MSRSISSRGSSRGSPCRSSGFRTTRIGSRCSGIWCEGLVAESARRRDGRPSPQRELGTVTASRDRSRPLPPSPYPPTRASCATSAGGDARVSARMPAHASSRSAIQLRPAFVARDRRHAELDITDGQLRPLPTTPSGGCWRSLSRARLPARDATPTEAVSAATAVGDPQAGAAPFSSPGAAEPRYDPLVRSTLHEMEWQAIQRWCDRLACSADGANPCPP